MCLPWQIRQRRAFGFTVARYLFWQVYYAEHKFQEESTLLCCVRVGETLEAQTAKERIVEITDFRSLATSMERRGLTVSCLHDPPDVCTYIRSVSRHNCVVSYDDFNFIRNFL